ncbi:uncharacterized protein F5891DRAFT_1125633 [Suillus fuscotomentosus]|uniref:CxC2-like cysteine cluster KDZ transposase-associated domain-containing protein n=1 Tax=Suillus fuscotomentosus TaxID=1912939 RepID=A0AAD4EHN6_9AGAM|nr:uncharacterized protein F5891DRAFT_1125633 [Suillus fuscotomentosus]KAG1906246.1 hypothetical protein F5891DRAFT_1125633 [Suillus fuscotomentosus]
MWNSDFFESITLKALGLHVQLGHTPGERCYNAQPVSCDEFTVIDAHGIHDVAVDFCGCETAQIRYKQLLRARWFPATTTDPRTAATFSVLELFHLLSFESKVSAYEFYHSLARRSDNTGISPIKDQWRHLLQLMRAGHGHDPNGIEATPDGGCVVQCPACPHPGINIPDGWENSPPDIRWRYVLFLAIDANFRLKRKAISSDDRNPSLNSGWAYFVEERAYKQFLSEHSTERQERSTCVGHNAVNTADTKASRGLAAMGVGSVVCARHEMRLPNSVGDLQKGEKYINMDYLVFSVLVSFGLAVFNLSYDIACQWHKKLWSRNSTMPQRLQFDYENKIVRFFVPKFHLKAHIQSYQTTFSFNFSKWVGRTDGEAPERGWADINRVATSTREMGPGNRRDTLDDHFGDWNWKKISMLAHREELAELEGAIDASTLALWRADVEAWEEDNTKPNPFESRVVPMTQAMVRLEFAERERRDLQDGIDVSLHAEISPSMLIANGLELEDQQRQIRADRKTLSQNPTDNQKAKLQMCSNTLQRKLDAWAQVQILYMPTVASLCIRAQRNDIPQDEMPKDFILFLPSQLNAITPCDLLLCQIEWQLRYAQADDALNDVRQNVRLHAHLNTFKTLHIRGQRASTRARSALDLAETKKCGSRLKYEAARVALDNLGDRLGMVGWRDTFRPLNVADMRPMGDAGSAGQSEGRRDIPWIWKAPGVLHNNDAGLQDCLRVEWCKARARASRWSEEFALLIEEMQRVLAFFRWEMAQWNGRGTARSFTKDADREGSFAYAQRQISVREGLVIRFSTLWRDALSAVVSELDPVPEINTEMADDQMPSLEGPPLEGDDE